MQKFYISFGQNHTHAHDDVTLDKDCIAVVEGESAGEVHTRAMEAFNAKFYTVYEKVPDMKFFPRGLINIIL